MRLQRSHASHPLVRGQGAILRPTDPQAAAHLLIRQTNIISWFNNHLGTQCPPASQPASQSLPHGQAFERYVRLRWNMLVSPILTTSDLVNSMRQPPHAPILICTSFAYTPLYPSFRSIPYPPLPSFPTTEPASTRCSLKTLPSPCAAKAQQRSSPPPSTGWISSSPSW